MTKKEFYEALCAAGHVLKTYEDDLLDIFAFSVDEYHNGPRCVRCGTGWCHHVGCREEPIIVCPGDVAFKEWQSNANAAENRLKS